MIKILRSVSREYRAASTRYALIALGNAGYTEHEAKRLLWLHLNK